MRTGLLLLLWLVPALGWAHPLDVGTLDVRIDGSEIQVRLDIAVTLAFDLAHVPDDQQSAVGLVAAAPSLAIALLQGAPILADGAECAWQPDAVVVVEGVRVVLTESAHCPQAPTQLRWRLPVLEDAPLATRILGKGVVGEHTTEFLLAPGRGTIALEGAGPPRFAELVALGAQSVGALPKGWLRAGRVRFPEGFDSLLFLLALLGAGGPWRDRLRAVLAMLAGQALGCGLGIRGAIHLAPLIVGMVTALAVIWVAVENALDRPGARRWFTAGLSGIFLGLGLAPSVSALGPAATSLGGFAVGVELVQLLTLALGAGLARVLPHRALAIALGVAGAMALGSRVLL